MFLCRDFNKKKRHYSVVNYNYIYYYAIIYEHWTVPNANNEVNKQRANRHEAQ